MVRLSASRCIWANLRPGKVRKAPIREQSNARISLNVSLEIGPLQRRKQSYTTVVSWSIHEAREYKKINCKNTDNLLTGTPNPVSPETAERCLRSLQNLVMMKRWTVIHSVEAKNNKKCYPTWWFVRWVQRSTHQSPDQTQGSSQWWWGWPWLSRKRKKQM